MTVVVLEHVLDEDAGVYRITFAEQITHKWNETVPPDPEEEEPSEVEPRVIEREEVVLGEPETVVFSADDDQWRAANGHRRKLEDVAADQRQMVKAALNARAREAEARELDAARVTELPGVGEAL